MLHGSTELCQNQVYRLYSGSKSVYQGQESSIEVYIAGCFSENSIVMTKALQLCHDKTKHGRKGILEVNQGLKDEPSSFAAIQLPGQVENIFSFGV